MVRDDFSARFYGPISFEAQQESSRYGAFYKEVRVLFNVMRFEDQWFETTDDIRTMTED